MDPSVLCRRQRAAARVALYGSLLLTGLVASAVFPYLEDRLAVRDPEWSLHDYEREPAVRQLQQLLRIDTTPGTGREIDAARHLAAELESMGLEPVVEELIEGKANLWAIVEGEDPSALALHSHLDSDPVPDPEVWSYDPFGGVVDGPWIYGRGAFDMKSITVAQLEAVRAVQQRVRETGRRPPKSLVFLATSSEETGSELGARWVVEQHPELVHRFWALLTEGGVTETVQQGKIKYWGISFAQKRFIRLVACSPSREQLEQLRQALLEQESYRRRLLPEVREFLEAYAPSREELLLRQVVSRPEGPARGMWSFRFLPNYLSALYRNEVYPLAVAADSGTGGYRLPIVLHLLPDEDLEAARAELLPPWLVQGIRIVIAEEPLGPAAAISPTDHEAFRVLVDVVRARYDTDAVGPYFLAFYENDARFFRTAGVPSYGFSPFGAFAPDSFTVGGVNERIALPAFLDGVDVYHEAVFALIGWGAESSDKK